MTRQGVCINNWNIAFYVEQRFRSKRSALPNRENALIGQPQRIAENEYIGADTCSPLLVRPVVWIVGHFDNNVRIEALDQLLNFCEILDDILEWEHSNIHMMRLAVWI